MKTVLERVCDEIIINKSKFITIITPLYDVSEVLNIINSIKSEYKGATHYCYGYIMDGMEKCSDDGEPSGTAGIPILNVLKKNELTGVLCVVVRYFGGIKLGAGGLTRAYSNSVINILSKCRFGTMEIGFKVTIQFDYDNIKAIDYILKDYEIQKCFDEKIKYTFYILKKDFNEISENIMKYGEIIEKENVKMIKDDN